MNGDIEAATPALCRIQLGAELRRLRQGSGFNSSQVVRRLLWSPSKLTRLEFGDNSIVEPEDVAALCAIYEADEETLARLTSYATITRTRKNVWPLADYRPMATPRIAALSAREESARTSRSFNGEWVPGLLQTEGYMRAIHRLTVNLFSAEEIDHMISVRLARSHVIHRTDAPLRLVQILDESVLRRRVGGASVTREQLLHIAEAMTLPNVHVQVVPFEAGAHPGMTGTFTLFYFPKATAMSPLVYIESLAEAWIMRRDANVELYEAQFADLQAIALSPSDSLDMIHKAIKDLPSA